MKIKEVELPDFPYNALTGTIISSEAASIFEELIRKFSEQSNETAGEHFTPREVVRLMDH